MDHGKNTFLLVLSVEADARRNMARLAQRAMGKAAARRNPML